MLIKKKEQYTRSHILEVCSCNFSQLGNLSGKWVWGHESLPALDSYCYLGIKIGSNGSWDKHIKSLIMCNKQTFGSLYQVLHNFALDLSTCRHISRAVLRPSLEYGCEVWNTNKCQTKVLGSPYNYMHASIF